MIEWLDTHAWVPGAIALVILLIVLWFMFFDNDWL